MNDDELLALGAAMNLPIDEALRRMWGEYHAELHNDGGVLMPDGIITDERLRAYMHREPPGPEPAVWRQAEGRLGKLRATALQCGLVAFHVARLTTMPRHYHEYVGRVAGTGPDPGFWSSTVYDLAVPMVRHILLMSGRNIVRGAAGFRGARYAGPAAEHFTPHPRLRATGLLSRGQFEAIRWNLIASVIQAAECPGDHAPLRACRTIASSCYAADLLSNRMVVPDKRRPHLAEPFRLAGADPEPMIRRVLDCVVGPGPRAFDAAWFRWNGGVVATLAESCWRESFGGADSPADFLATVSLPLEHAPNYSNLPFLADALEEAGCADQELLNHLRLPPASHMLGCWALDFLTQQGRKVRT